MVGRRDGRGESPQQMPHTEAGDQNSAEQPLREDVPEKGSLQHLQSTHDTECVRESCGGSQSRGIIFAVADKHHSWFSPHLSRNGIVLDTLRLCANIILDTARLQMARAHYNCLKIIKPNAQLLFANTDGLV